jgi:hypothetical protein
MPLLGSGTEDQSVNLLGSQGIDSQPGGIDSEDSLNVYRHGLRVRIILENQCNIYCRAVDLDTTTSGNFMSQSVSVPDPVLNSMIPNTQKV